MSQEPNSYNVVVAVEPPSLAREMRLRRLPRALSVSKFTMVEMLILTACAAFALSLARHGVVGLAACFMLTVLAFRTAIVDFSVCGTVATLLTIVFGTSTIGLLVLWSTTW